MMKLFATFAFMILCPFVSVQGQNYLEHVQKEIQGKGTVTVHQSQEIDQLVNGAKTVAQPPQDRITHKDQEKVTTVHPQTEIQKTAEKADERKERVEKEVAPKKTESHRDIRKTETTANDDELEIPVIDMRKKVMRGSYKVTGYRVQAFAGGNSRKDRQKAESIGSAIKMRFPDQPVYVHFYSPRWICRVGNFRSYAAANQLLKKIRAMGYRSACLVKGKITVQK